MLTENEHRHLWDEAVAAFEGLEGALLAIIAKGLVKGQSAVDVTIGAGMAIAAQREAVSEAVRRNMVGAFTWNAVTDVRDAVPKAERADVTKWAKSEAAKIAEEAIRDTRMPMEQILNGMREGARQGYYEALRTAKRYVNVAGYENAMTQAVSGLAESGITAYSYVRKDGTVVRVPVDVGVRRELTRAGKDRMTSQTLDIARRNGCTLVDVSFCPDARQSHAIWEGQRYQLDGDDLYPNFEVACMVGNMVEGYGGYNCHHTIRIAYEGSKFGFSDPLEGTGYTNEQVRELTSQQRKLENEIRKEKRVRDTLKSAELPTKDATQKIKGYQQQLNELINENAAVLKRQRWRENLYDKAMR